MKRQSNVAFRGVAVGAINTLRYEGLEAAFNKASIHVQEKFLNTLVADSFISAFVRDYARVKTLDDAIEFTTSFRALGASVQASQDSEEIGCLLRAIAPSHPAVVIEIGTGNGGTLLLFTHVARRDAILISLDLPASLFGLGYPRWRETLYGLFRRNEQRIHLVRGDSHCRDTLTLVTRMLNGKKADVLFIDGDHSYEGVKNDFQMYSSLVDRGGLVAFHDITPHALRPDVGVPKFWNEVKNQYCSEEIIRTGSSCGIGIIHM